MKTFSYHFYSLTMICLLFAACGGTGNQSKSTSTTASITQKSFGQVDGKEATLYTITNSKGASVSISDFGGIVQSIIVPDKNGKMADVALGFENVNGYKTKDGYLGAIIGRYGNRIANGKFSLDDKEYTMATNNGPNHLHGGLSGFNDKIWKAEKISGDKYQGLKLTYTSADGEEGYPGKLNVTVTYTWTEDNELKIDYMAVTDKSTVCNLTNHLYFNLSGDPKKGILNEVMQINATRYTPVDETLIPTGELAPVEGTPFDFTKAKTIGQDIKALGGGADGPVGGGYDHNYVIREAPGEMILAAVTHNPESGRVMETYTTEPGVQFYTSNFMGGTFKGKDGSSYEKHVGFCLETQHFPDSPNKPGFPSTRLNPGKTYKTSTVYKFSVKK